MTSGGDAAYAKFLERTFLAAQALPVLQEILQPRMWFAIANHTLRAG